MSLDPDPLRPVETDTEPEPPIAADLIVFGGIVLVGLGLVLMWWGFR